MIQFDDDYRLPEDSNLHYSTKYSFGNDTVCRAARPIIVNYMQRIELTTHKVLAEHPHAIAVRVDLRLPDDEIESLFGRPIFNLFIDSLREKVERRRETKQNDKKRSVYVHPTKVYFVWAKEYSSNGNPHYHVILYFNRQTFRGLGSFDPQGDNLYGLICQAWANALGWDLEDAQGLVHFPDNGVYELHCDRSDSEFLYRASYLAKVDTKRFGDGKHRFGSSR